MSFPSQINLSSLNGSNGFRLDGVSAQDNSGNSVASAGDVNGDGFGDIIIGANQADPNGVLSGASYVVFGAAGGFASNIDLSALNGSNGFRLDGASQGDVSGYSVASAGDVNGDGFADIIIGATFADPNGSNSGASYVVFGAAGGFASSLNLSALNGSNGFRLAGVSANDLAGTSVASAGDVNGDGFGDIIIGANQDLSSGGSGVSYVAFGASGGFASSLELSALDGSNGFRLAGVSAGDLTGISVASAGDVNGDGFADVILGAHEADPNGDNSGAAYVVFGASAGFASSLSLSALDGSNGFRLAGVSAGDLSGWSAASAGDVNGDGFADIILGAYAADPNGGASGASYVVFGASGGFASSLDLSALNGSNGFRLVGVSEFDFSGFSVASAGDVNGDGFADIIVGARGADLNGFGSGASYVVFGKSGGFGSSLNLSALDGSNGFRLDGASLGDFTGWSLASAGDVNGDGHPDLAIAAPRADPNGDNSGSSYVYLNPTTGGIFARGTTLADTLRGTAENDVINGYGRDDALFGLGGSDTLYGGAGNDSLDGGAGNDVYLVEDAGDTIFDGAGDDVAFVVVNGVTAAAGIETWYLAGAATSLLGEAGANVLVASASLASTLDGAAGDDALWGQGGADLLTGGEGVDVLRAGGGIDTLQGGLGDDVLDGGAGADSLDGGAGNDIFVVDDLGDTVTDAEGTDLAFAVANGVTASAAVETWYLAGAANSLLGDGGGNVLVTNAGLASTLDGGAGDDTLWGQGTADRLVGGDGADVLRAGGGDDTLLGGAGNDQMVGGAGADRFAVQGAGWGYDQVFDFNSAEGDRLDFTGSGISFGQLTIYEVGGNTVVALGADRIDIYGVTGIVAGDFLFT